MSIGESRHWSAADTEHGWADGCGQKACVHDCLDLRLQGIIQQGQTTTDDIMECQSAFAVASVGSRWHPPACVAVAPARLSWSVRRALTCSPRDVATRSKNLSSRANRDARLQQMRTDGIDRVRRSTPNPWMPSNWVVCLLLVRGVRLRWRERR